MNKLNLYGTGFLIIVINVDLKNQKTGIGTETDQSET